MLEFKAFLGLRNSSILVVKRHQTTNQNCVMLKNLKKNLYHVADILHLRITNFLLQLPHLLTGYVKINTTV